MKHTMTEEQRAAQRAYHRAYREANREKLRQQVSARRAAKSADFAAYQHEYYTANKARIRETNREWRIKNREKVVADRKAYKSANRAKINAQERERHHAVKAEKSKTEQWIARWKRNNRRRPAKLLARNEILLGRAKPDVCDVCGSTDRIVFDHCHNKGHARGWLCDRCNIALGCAKDDVNILRKLIVYIERNRENTSPQLALAGI